MFWHPNLINQKNYQDKVKLQDFVVLFTYTVQTFTLFVTEVQFTDLSSNSSYTLIYMIIRHFRISFNIFVNIFYTFFFSIYFVFIYLHLYTFRYNIAIQTCLILIISQNKSSNLFSWLIQPLWDMVWSNEECCYLCRVMECRLTPLKQ